MKYLIVTKLNELSNIIAGIEQAGEVVVDLETTSLATHSSTIEIVGIGLCYSDSTAYYLPLINEPAQEIKLSDLSQIIENDSISKIGHNIKYDARVLNRFGLDIKNIKFDTLIASYCLHGDRTKHNLDDLTLEHLNHVKIRTKDVIPRKSKKLPNPTMAHCPIPQVAMYCCEDVYYTYQLYKLFKGKLEEPSNSAAKKLFYDIEMPVLPVLISMECAGVSIDRNRIVELNTKLTALLETEKQAIDSRLNRPLVLTNPSDVAKAIFEDLKIHEAMGITPLKTATGKYKTDKKTLELLKSDKFIESILNVKKLNKFINTYMLSFPAFISDHTGKIHAFFNQAVTATGRLSSSEPNLQNQPQRDELGKEIRELYISRWHDSGGVILSSDYSQAELRILAHMSNDEVLLDIFRRDADAHLGVASKIYRKPEDQITKQERTFTKTINFGLLYGMGPKKLAMQLGITKDEATLLMDQYLGTLKGVKNFIISSEKFLNTNGYTETFFGRRRYIPKVFSNDKLEQWAARREGTNHIVQGTNADITKKAMIRCQEEFYKFGLKSLLVLQVHDELVFDVHPDEIEIIKPIVLGAMQGIVNFSIPMKAEAAFGESWGKAH